MAGIVCPRHIKSQTGIAIGILHIYPAETRSVEIYSRACTCANSVGGYFAIQSAIKGYGVCRPHHVYFVGQNIAFACKIKPVSPSRAYIKKGFAILSPGGRIISTLKLNQTSGYSRILNCTCGVCNPESFPLVCRYRFGRSEITTPGTCYCRRPVIYQNSCSVDGLYRVPSFIPSTGIRILRNKACQTQSIG